MSSQPGLVLLVQGEGGVTAALGLSHVLKDILSSQVSLTTVISFFPPVLLEHGHY